MIINRKPHIKYLEPISDLICKEDIMQLGWIDFSTTERNKVLSILDLLSEKGTLDELGISPIRDGFANIFFPGTSTIQTRAKYFFIIPYEMKELETKDGINIYKVKIGYGIRQMGIALTDLTYEPDMQLSFFENHEDDENEMQLEVAMVGIRNKYGKNALLKGFNLFDKATGIKRNTMVGGHNG